MLSHLRNYLQFTPKLANNVYIDESAIVIGRVELGNNSSVWPLTVIRGDVNFIRIGERSNIQDGSILHVSRKTPINLQGFPLLIGNDVTIGHNAILHGCEIGNFVLVGMGTTILDGVIINDNVMIGAGSLIPPNKHLASGFLYMGNPIKQIRPLTPTEINFLALSADNYVQLKNEYLMTDD